MLAVDTNVIVRYLTRDDLQQALRAKKLVDENEIFVAATVLLETEWVLRSVYRLTPDEIIAGISNFLGLPQVTVEDPATVAKALQWAAGGMDLADALHLARTQHCDAFISFDRRLAAAVSGMAGVTVRAP